MFEKVSPWHPDKLADRIAGAIVDLAYNQEEDPRIAVEVLLGHGLCYIIAETSVEIDVEEVGAAVERITGENDILIEYTEKPQDAHLAAIQGEELVAADNGIFRGTVPDVEEKLLRRIGQTLWAKFPCDGKMILDDGHLTICQSNATEEEIREAIKPVIDTIEIWRPFRSIMINPIGDWTGGPNVDTGATNRKLGSDMGKAITGGGLHGKDLSKADVSVNIYLHELAKAHNAPVEASCRIGGRTLVGLNPELLLGSVFRYEGDIVGKTDSFELATQVARRYIKNIGGFERFAEWGLI